MPTEVAFAPISSAAVVEGAAAGLLRPRPMRLTGRTVKLCAAALITVAGAYGIFSESEYVTSGNAVVSAYVVAVRAPIEGVLSGLPPLAGTIVRQGSVLGRVENERVDNQHLDALRTLEQTARSEADALEAEQGTLKRQREALIARSLSHAKALLERFDQEAAGAARKVSASGLALDQGNRELKRARELHVAGIMADAEFERISSSAGVLSEQKAAQEAALAALRGESAATLQGLLTEPGTNNDVSYSRQRADELSIKLAENERMLIALRVQARDAAHALEVEQSRAGLMHASDLSVPLEALLWKLNASNGERVAAGDQIVSLIDCRHQFVLAKIPQDRVPDIALNGTVKLRLAGDELERRGTVLSVAGDSESRLDEKFAAVPMLDPTLRMATVLVRLEAPSGAGQQASDCLVGRTARVLVPTSASNLVTRWFRRAF